MKILISGSTGFVGIPLVKSLKDNGHEVYELVRHGNGSEFKIKWNVDKGYLDVLKLPQDIDVVVNLAGENIAQGRWTSEIKDKIYNSRIQGTKLIASILAGMSHSPKVWINASAIGYYGLQSGIIKTENLPAGDNFLAKVCVDWEQEAKEAAKICDRVVIFRFAMILDKNGGALSKMLPIFERGLGATFGSGKQNMSWVALCDVINIINFAINNNISGVFNIVSPGLVTNKEFTQILAQTLGKPALLWAPKFILKLMFGEMAEEILLQDIKASPLKIMGEGYEFKEKNLKLFLESNLKEDNNE